MKHVRALYRRIFPEPLRRAVRDFVIPQRMYGRGFFSDMERAQESSYGVMAESLVRELAPESIFDAGCGTGGFLRAMREAGTAVCRGVEYHEEALRECRRKNLDVVKGDLTRYLQIPASFTVVSCMEVAEHLPESSADTLVRSLTSGPQTIVFSAATPGQGGHDHINEQPHGYWLEKFAANDFVPDQRLTVLLREEWTARGVVRWFARNIFVLRRNNQV